MPKLTKTCPNQDVINDKKIDIFLVTLDKLPSIHIFFCQLYVALDNFLSIFCLLSRLDSDMFLSIRALFPCTGISLNMRI